MSVGRFVAVVVALSALTAGAAPSDPFYPQQWALHDPLVGIRAEQAWTMATGRGVRVAVLDTGTRPHAELVGKLLPGYDFLDAKSSGDGDGPDRDATDMGDGDSRECLVKRIRLSTWHGTKVAGVIAASRDDGLGLVGAAPDAAIVPVRVLGRCGGDLDQILHGMLWAAGVHPTVPNPYPARVLNLSFGENHAPCAGTAYGRRYQAVLDRLKSAGVVVVAAAMNYGQPVEQVSPASCRGVIAVGAVRRDGSRPGYSDYGRAVALSAPGGETGQWNGRGVDPAAGLWLLSDRGGSYPAGDGYLSDEGTSFAAPLVAATVAMMLELKPELRPGQVRHVLLKTARPFPQPCQGCGAGMLDAEAALKRVLDPTPIPEDAF
ncbi:S8 family serine peptidase [Chitinimonas lacunae]|uniref:S8 family serine peptidase n=1 Tax=Chitinimonas lacunae TaxID=1963018 RepID=A0ABV8MKF1_9NEIS